MSSDGEDDFMYEDDDFDDQGFGQDEDMDEGQLFLQS